MIRLIVPDLRYSELNELKAVINSGMLTQGSMTPEFEKNITEYIGVKYGIAVNSGTSALHIALASIGITQGDEVIVPDYTFPATANTVLHTGGTPVLADIDLDSYNINLHDMEDKITDKTKAIMPVHQFGCPANMGEILKIAKKHDLKIIEDAACALGSKYRDKMCGSFGAAACLSFHPRKVLTTGEGGMVLTNDKEIYQKCNYLRSHGIQAINGEKKQMELGYNFRLSEINSAIGVNQMKRISQNINRRREIAKIMNSEFEKISGVSVPHEPSFGVHSYQSYVLLLDLSINRDKLIKLIMSKGIEATSGAMSIFSQPYYQKLLKYTEKQLPNSVIAFKRTITLPLYPQLSQEEISLIISSVKSSIGECVL